MNIKRLERCVELGTQALERGELPVGVVLTGAQDEVLAEVARPAGLLEHSELVALRSVQDWLHRHRHQAVLYSSLEPCLMCFGAALNAKVGRVVYALRDGQRDYAAVFQATFQATSDLRYRAQEWQVHAEPDPGCRDQMRELMARYWLGQGRPDKAEAFRTGGQHWGEPPG